MHVLILEPSRGISNCLFLRDFVFIFTTRRHSLSLNFISVSHSDLCFSYTPHPYKYGLCWPKVEVGDPPFHKENVSLFFVLFIIYCVSKPSCGKCSPCSSSVSERRERTDGDFMLLSLAASLFRDWRALTFFQTGQLLKHWGNSPEWTHCNDQNASLLLVWFVYFYASTVIGKTFTG